MVGHSYPIRLLQGCRNPDTICVRAIENVSHSISNPLFQTTGHAVWSTTFIYSSFIRPPCTLILETAVCRAHEEKSEGSQIKIGKVLADSQLVCDRAGRANRVQLVRDLAYRNTRQLNAIVLIFPSNPCVPRSY